VSQSQEKQVIKEPAVLLKKLTQWLRDRENNLGSSLNSAGQSLGGVDPQRVLQLVNQRATILQVLDVLKELESGSDVNAECDFLGADSLPLVHETRELLEQ
jgi:hypothetical protein